MIKVIKSRVYLTETTLKELLKAVEKAKDEAEEKGGFIDSPLPEGDISNNAMIKAQRERGHVLVESPFSSESFMISIEAKNNTQESLGYRLS